MRTLASLLTCPLAVWLILLGCATDTRVVALRGAYTTTSIAADTEATIEHAGTEKIIRDAKAAKKSGDEVRASIEEWRAKVDQIDAVIGVAFKAIAAAFALNDDKTDAAALAAAANAAAAVAKLKTDTGSNAP